MANDIIASGPYITTLHLLSQLQSLLASPCSFFPTFSGRVQKLLHGFCLSEVESHCLEYTREG